MRGFGFLCESGLVFGEPGRAVPLRAPVVVEFRIDAVGDESAFAEMGSGSSTQLSSSRSPSGTAVDAAAVSRW